MKGSSARGAWLGLSCSLLVVGLVLATSGLVSWSLTGPPGERYVVVLDAGSVHTSVYTYRSVAELCSQSDVSLVQVLLPRAGERHRD